MSAVTNKMICAAHDVTMKRGVVLSHEILAEIYVAMAKNKREWVGLTDAEKEKLVEAFYGTDIQRLEAVEARLKEKNGL